VEQKRDAIIIGQFCGQFYRGAAIRSNSPSCRSYPSPARRHRPWFPSPEGRARGGGPPLGNCANET
jgi:hypothetical protein